MNQGLIYSFIMHIILLIVVFYIPKSIEKNYRHKVNVSKMKISFKKIPKVAKVITPIKKSDQTDVNALKISKKKEPVINKELKKKKSKSKAKKQVPIKKDNQDKKVKETSVFQNIPDKSLPDEIAEDDIITIQDQVQDNWNKTPCWRSEGKVIRLQVLVAGNCELVFRSVLESAAEKACTESSIRAVLNTGKLNLSLEKCLEYNKSVIILNFENTN